MVAAAETAIVRRVRILNYSHEPPREDALVELDASGTVTIVHVDTLGLRDMLTRGLRVYKQTRTIVTTADGARFLDVLHDEFKSVASMAVEDRLTTA